MRREGKKRRGGKKKRKRWKGWSPKGTSLSTFRKGTEEYFWRPFFRSRKISSFSFFRTPLHSPFLTGKQPNKLLDLPHQKQHTQQTTKQQSTNKNGRLQQLQHQRLALIAFIGTTGETRLIIGVSRLIAKIIRGSKTYSSPRNHGQGSTFESFFFFVFFCASNNSKE